MTPGRQRPCALMMNVALYAIRAHLGIGFDERVRVYDRARRRSRGGGLRDDRPE